MEDPTKDISIRPATANDSEALARIYNHYILNTIITFEEDALSARDIAGRIAAIAALPLPWLVAEQQGQIAGYAYATGWRTRRVYRYSAEITVYVDAQFSRRGIGTKLYEALFPALRECGMHSVIGGIALPNPASVALHEKFGMRQVAHFKEVGFKFGRWIDVGYWQAALDDIRPGDCVAG